MNLPPLVLTRPVQDPPVNSISPYLACQDGGGGRPRRQAFDRKRVTSCQRLPNKRWPPFPSAHCFDFPLHPGSGRTTLPLLLPCSTLGNATTPPKLATLRTFRCSKRCVVWCCVLPHRVHSYTCNLVSCPTIFTIKLHHSINAHEKCIHKRNGCMRTHSHAHICTHMRTCVGLRTLQTQIYTNIVRAICIDVCVCISQTPN